MSLGYYHIISIGHCQQSATFMMDNIIVVLLKTLVFGSCWLLWVLIADSRTCPFYPLKCVGHEQCLCMCSVGIFIFIFWVKQLLSKAPDNLRRLYPPGKIYHFVYKQPGRPAHRPIRVRVVPSAENRFERIALSASGTIKNHYILALTKHMKVHNKTLFMKFDWQYQDQYNAKVIWMSKCMDDSVATTVQYWTLGLVWYVLQTFNWPEELKDQWLTSVLQTA